MRLHLKMGKVKRLVTMLVYVASIQNSYGGGLAIIAARNKREAEAQLKTGPYVYWEVKLSRTLSTSRTTAGILHSDFYIE